MKKVLFFILFMVCGVSFAETNDDVVTYSGLYNEILEQQIEFPDIVFAQAVLESGSFTSRVFKQNKNLFGMRLPKKRKTTAVGQKYGYAVYSFWQESVEDYGYYQEFLIKDKKMTRSQYLAHIDKRYSESKGYVTKLHRIIKELGKFIYEPPSDRNDGVINDF